MKVSLPSVHSAASRTDKVPPALRRKFPAGPRPARAAVALDADAGARHFFGTFGVQWKIDGSDTAGRFSVVHHPIPPRSLVAPLHRHHREDEYSYIITGTMGALLGDEVVTAGPGTWVFKPRGQWHTFWNAGDTPCEIIEIISPAGFEDFFRELTTAWGHTEQFAALAARYGLEVRPETVPELCERFGLTSARQAG